MNGITERLINSVEPISALIVYANENDEYYLESHKIFNGQMGPGQPVSESFVQEIAERVRMKDRGPAPYSGGLMPKNILYLDQRTNRLEMLWYMSPRKVFIRFDKALKIKSGEMYLPGLIYHSKGDDLNVYAVKRAPYNNTVLFRAPFFNTDRNGSVCMGTAKAEYPEFPTYESIMKYWDIMLFGADFSHLSGAVNPTKKKLDILCRSLIDKNKPFPLDQLVAMKSKNNPKNYLTLEEYIESL